MSKDTATWLAQLGLVFWIGVALVVLRVVG